MIDTNKAISNFYVLDKKDKAISSWYSYLLVLNDEQCFECFLTCFQYFSIDEIKNILSAKLISKEQFNQLSLTHFELFNLFLKYYDNLNTNFIDLTSELYYLKDMFNQAIQDVNTNFKELDTQLNIPLKIIYK